MPKILDSWPRLAPGVITAVGMAAIQIGGYENRDIAKVLWIVLGVIVLVTFVTWKPIRGNIPLYIRLQVHLGRGRGRAARVGPYERGRDFVVHRGVRFEDWASGVSLPICAEHLCLLHWESTKGPSSPLDEDTIIRDDAGLRMICPEDGETRVFDGLGPVRVGAVQEEAISRLHGVRNRRRSASS